MKKFNLRDSFKSKSVKYGGYATLFTVAVLAALVVFNLIIQQLPAQVDLTENKMFSLSDQTQAIIASMEKPVTIYGLFSIGSEPGQLMEVIRRYENSSKMIDFKLIDPDTNPGFAQKYAPTGETLRAGSLVVESGPIFKAIDYYDLYNVSYQDPNNPRVQSLAFEQRITNALLYAASGKTPMIYQITGHGEATLLQLGLRDQVMNENYAIEDLNLLLADDVPEDAEIVMVLSPERDLAEVEAEKLRTYLNKGGKALFLLDFRPDQQYPVLKSVLESFGIQYDNSVVVMEGDPSHYLRTQAGTNPYVLIPALQTHDITSPLRGEDLIMVMPFVVPIETTELRRRTIESENLLLTSSNSWVRTDYNNPSAERVPSDRVGPVPMSIAVTEREMEMGQKTFRIVAIGSSVFLRSPFPYFGQVPPGNVDFFMNAVNWTANRTESISIRPKSLFVFPMQMTGLQVLLLAALFTLIIPILLLAAGLIVWLRRRHL